MYTSLCGNLCTLLRLCRRRHVVKVNRRVPLLVLDIRIGTSFQKQVDHLGVGRERLLDQRRVVVVLILDVLRVLVQQRGHLALAVVREHQGGVPVVVLRVEVGPRLDEELDDLDVSAHGGRHQGVGAVLVGVIHDLSILSHEELRDVVVALARRGDHRRDALITLRIDVNLAGGNQGLRDVEQALVRRLNQVRHVVGVLVRQVRALLDEQQRKLLVPDQNGIEEQVVLHALVIHEDIVRVRAVLHQQRGEVGMIALHRVQQGRPVLLVGSRHVRLRL
mmetsp:Transcript_15684/g.59653  ORF Transcript_15684/g.59653 Transcript_15684/m.59653 type:complete len:277 (-) Transcript_15684:1778-2608(-)